MPASTPATPPYSVPALHFPFRALAEQAAYARLGGAREVALACLMAARLATAASTAETFPPNARAARTAAARAWFASLALPAALRAPLDRLCGAAVDGDGAGTGAALAGVLAAARRHLNTVSVAELERLVRTLRAPSHPDVPKVAAAGGTRNFGP